MDATQAPPSSTESAAAADLAEIRRALGRAVATVCPSWLADQREDIVQAAMLRVLAILERGEEQRVRSSSYLWRVAHSATLDEIRRARRRDAESTVEGEQIDRTTATDRAGPERRARSREIGRAIQQCLGTLVDPRRHVAVLHLLGYGLTETARVLGWPRKRVDNLLYRGLADLRRCLEGKQVVP